MFLVVWSDVLKDMVGFKLDDDTKIPRDVPVYTKEDLTIITLDPDMTPDKLKIIHVEKLKSMGREAEPAPKKEPRKRKRKVRKPCVKKRIR